MNERLNKLAQRVINHLRAQPPGHEMPTPEITELLYLPDGHLVSKVLDPPPKEGIVKARADRHHLVWSLASA